MMRLMEVLLHGGSQLVGWRTAQIHESIRAAFGLTREQYTITQLRYEGDGGFRGDVEEGKRFLQIHHGGALGAAYGLR